MRGPRHDRTDQKAVVAAESRMAESSARYAEVGLVENADKRNSRQRRAEILGADLDGDAGLLAGSGDKRLRLAVASMRLSCQREALGAAVRQVVSGWMFCMAFARHALSVFHHVFTWLGLAT